MIGVGLCVPVLRGAGSPSDPPPPPPAFTLTETADGRLLVAGVQADLAIDIRAPDIHAGTVAVRWQDYAQGPVALAAPGLAGDPMPGAVLEAVPGLWLHQGPDPVPTWIWQARAAGGAFADLPDTGGATLAVTEAMRGRELRVVEIVAEGVAAVSDPVAVPEAPAGPDFTLTQETDGRIVLSGATGALEIAITAPAAYAGTHSVPAEDHGDGIALVVPPLVEGPAEAGGTLTARPGLWLFAGDVPDPTLQWQARPDSGAAWTDLDGETGPSLVLTAAQAGHLVRAVEALGSETAPSAAVAVADPVAGPSLIDFAATTPFATGKATLTPVAGGWRMVPDQTGGTAAQGGTMSWDTSALPLIAGRDYVFALRLRRDAAEAVDEITRLRTGNNNALTSHKTNLGLDVLAAAADVTLSLRFTHDGADTRIGVRTEGWETGQTITATELSLTEQTT